MVKGVSGSSIGTKIEKKNISSNQNISGFNFEGNNSNTITNVEVLENPDILDMNELVDASKFEMKQIDGEALDGNCDKVKSMLEDILKKNNTTLDDDIDVDALMKETKVRSILMNYMIQNETSTIPDRFLAEIVLSLYQIVTQRTRIGDVVAPVPPVKPDELTEEEEEELRKREEVHVEK